MGHLKRINPGEFVADALGNPDPVALAWHGYKAIAFYWKNTDRAKLERYWAHGIGTWLIHEWYADDADGGYQRGYTYGKQARAAADKIGYPGDVAMICANDKDTTAPTLQTHIDYQRGFDAGYGQTEGIYADRDVIEAIGAGYPVNWQCGASWFSKLWVLGKWVYPNSQYAHFRQYGDKFGLGIDHNVCLRECFAWLPNSPDLTEDDDMPTIYKFTDAYAVLVQRQDLRGPGIFVSWSGPGSDPKVIPWLTAMVKAGAKEVTGTVASLCPGLKFVGDPKLMQDKGHAWTGNEFKEVLPEPTFGNITVPPCPAMPTKLTGTIDLSAETITGTLA